MPWTGLASFSLLMDFAFKSTAVLGLAWLLVAMLHRSSAASRHLIWTSAFLAIVALPFLVVSLPRLSLPVPEKVLKAAPMLTFRADAAVPADSGQVAPAATRMPLKRPARWRPSWSAYLPLIWAGGTFALWARMVLAWTSMRRLRGRSKPLRIEPHTIAISPGIQILEAPPQTMPMTFGWLRPCIFLPSEAAEWSAGRVRTVLLHELAHIQRGDVAVRILARAALSLYWWNPLAWKAWRELIRMQEQAADDVVLTTGASASDYAAHLLEVARLMNPNAGSAAAIAMAHPSHLEGRLRAILNVKISRKSPGRLGVLAAALASVAIIGPIAAIHAQQPAAAQLPADVDATIRAAKAQKNYGMLDRAADAFVRAGQLETAKKLMEAALEVRADLRGTGSASYLHGLLRFGDLERQMGDLDGAATLYERAASLPDRPELVPALTFLGIRAYGKNDTAAAQAYIERAMAVDRSGRTLPAGKTFPLTMAW